MDSENFKDAIEDIVWMKDVTYLEAVLIFAEKNEIEPEQLSKLARSNFLKELEMESRKFNLLKRS
jgi:hypothetical protein